MGLLVSQIDVAFETGQAGDQFHQVLDADLHAGTQVDRFGASCIFQPPAGCPQPHLPHTGIRAWESRRPKPRSNLHRCFGFEAFADQGRDHVRALGVEIIARTVQVDRQQEDGIEAVLLAVGLRLHQQHLLRQPVRRVGLFRVTVPQVFFFEWHRGELGVGADRAHRHKFFDPAQPGFVDQLHAHHQVVVEEFSRVLAVGADAAHLGSQVNDDIRVGCHPASVWMEVSLDQVVIFDFRDENISRAPALSFAVTKEPKKPGSAGDTYALILPEDWMSFMIAPSFPG